MNRRALVSIVLAGLGLGGLALGLLAAQESRPTSPFRPWNGSWEGSFSVYRSNGALENRLQVTQSYRERSPTEQSAEFVEIDQQGRRVTARARNWIEDGKLLCRVEKSDGSVSLHEGRPLEAGGLCWFHRDADREECFFERVISLDGETWYEIHGFGIYGADRANAYYFEGRYRRTGD